jgi:hypothetical protein
VALTSLPPCIALSALSLSRNVRAVAQAHSTSEQEERNRHQVHGYTPYTPPPLPLRDCLLPLSLLSSAGPPSVSAPISARIKESCRRRSKETESKQQRVVIVRGNTDCCYVCVLCGIVWPGYMQSLFCLVSPTGNGHH